MKKLIFLLLSVFFLIPQIIFAQSSCPADPENYSNEVLLEKCSIGDLSKLSEGRIMTFSSDIITQMSNSTLQKFTNDNLVKIGQAEGDLVGFLNRFSNGRLLFPQFPNHILNQLSASRIATFPCNIQQQLGRTCPTETSKYTTPSTSTPTNSPSPSPPTESSSSPSENPSASPTPKKPVRIIISQFERSDQTLDPSANLNEAKLNLNFDKNGVANVRFQVDYDYFGKDSQIYYIQYKLKQKTDDSVEYQEININGDTNCINQTKQALDLLKEKAPTHYANVKKYIGVIECVPNGSGMYAWENPPRFAVGEVSRNAGITWYAGIIVHDAHHSKLYHDYLESNPDTSVPNDIWTGKEAEQKCLDVQLDALVKIGGSQEELNAVKNAINTDFWKASVKTRLWSYQDSDIKLHDPIQTQFSIPTAQPTSAPGPLKLIDFNGDGVINSFDYSAFFQKLRLK